jgi:hypothetical protein
VISFWVTLGIVVLAAATYLAIRLALKDHRAWEIRRWQTNRHEEDWRRRSPVAR